MARLSACLVCCLLAACGSREEARPEPARAVEAPAPEPATAPLPEPRDVRFVTEDGVTLVGDLWPARDPSAPLVVLVHQLGSDRSEWAAIRERLREEPAIATLAFDLRGHGESTAGPDGPLEFHAFDEAAWAASREDVRGALHFVASSASEVTPSRIGAVGSSIGSTAVLAAAAIDPHLPVIVAISPGRAYHGFDALTPTLSLAGRRFLAVVSGREPDALDTARAMGRVTGGEVVEVDSDAHGLALLAADPTALEHVVTFLREAMFAEGSTPAVSVAPGTAEPPL